MAQGKHKAKQKLPSDIKQKKKKASVPKVKGRGIIAPKKAKLQEQHKFKKGLEIAMRAKIESDAASKSAVAEPKSLKIVAQSSNTDS